MTPFSPFGFQSMRGWSLEPSVGSIPWCMMKPEKDDHSYLVGLEFREDVTVPAECDCEVDRFNKEYACKHRVACATIGGPVVLNAATEFETPETTEKPYRVTTMADKLVRANGGTTTLDESNTDECDYTWLSDIPCFECYRTGKASL